MKFLKSNWRRLILLLALLLLIWGAYTAQRTWKLVRSLQGRLDKLQAVADGSADVALGDIGETLRGAHADLQALHGQVRLLLPLTRFLGWVPGVGGDIRAAPALLDTALAVTDAGVIAFDGLEPLLALTEGESDTEQPLAFVLQTLSDARPDLKAAQERLQAARAHRAKIDEIDEIGGQALSARTARLVEQLDRYLPLMETALDGGRLLPDMLGASGRRTYLILAQNNDELRATGGLISAAGTLVLENGEIVEISFKDSYTIDDFSQPYPFAPEPFWRYMGLQPWVFRDANWSPDFPTSAQKALELYHISHDLEADGVLSVDQQALQKVVAALAPLEVEGWPEPVTGENVISLIRLAWSPTEVEDWEGWDRDWWEQRKSFMGDLVGALRAKIEQSPGEIDWVALARATFQTLEERHVQAWLVDQGNPAAELLAEQGWDGALRQTSSDDLNDYLMVVDSNLGYNKVNAQVREELDYRVVVRADGTAQATLTIRHANRSIGTGACDQRPHYGKAYEDMVNRCYWDYLRVYAPAGSQLCAGTAHPVAADLLVGGERQTGAAEALPEEKGKAVFASFFVLPHGQETETRFVYELPPAVLERDGRWHYRLLVQKQAGTDAVPLRLTLALPPGAEILSVEPQARQPDPYTLVFETTLNKDQNFKVTFDPEVQR